MRHTAWISALLLIALTATGCGDKAGADGQSLVGAWKETIEQTPGDDMGNQIQQSMADATGKTIEIRDDNTFTLTIMGDASAGTWEYADGQLTFTYVETTGWLLGDESLILAIDDEGDTLRTVPSSGGTAAHARP